MQEQGCSHLQGQRFGFECLRQIVRLSGVNRGRRPDLRARPVGVRHRQGLKSTTRGPVGFGRTKPSAGAPRPLSGPPPISTRLKQCSDRAGPLGGYGFQTGQKVRGTFLTHAGSGAGRPRVPATGTRIRRSPRFGSAAWPAWAIRHILRFAGVSQEVQIGWKYAYVAVAIDPLMDSCGGHGST